MNFQIIDNDGLYAVQHEDGTIMAENLTLEDAAILSNQLETRYVEGDGESREGSRTLH